MTILDFTLLVGFFIVTLIARNVTKLKLCALCAAVSGTWIVLLGARSLGYEVAELTLGILLGGSTVGLMYYLAAKVPEQYEILKFPFLVTLLWLVYHIVKGVEDIVIGAAIVAGLWVIFGMIFALYTNDKLQQLGKKIIECCKNW